jgi:hypothetical protein
MRIQFIGAVRTVTGSMHLVEANGKKFLLIVVFIKGNVPKRGREMKIFHLIQEKLIS